MSATTGDSSIIAQQVAPRHNRPPRPPRWRPGSVPPRSLPAGERPASSPKGALSQREALSDLTAMRSSDLIRAGPDRRARQCVPRARIVEGMSASSPFNSVGTWAGSASAAVDQADRLRAEIVRSQGPRVAAYPLRRRERRRSRRRRASRAGRTGRHTFGMRAYADLALRTDQALRHGRSGTSSPRDRVRLQAAQRSQRQSHLRVERERRMAAGEDQAEAIVRSRRSPARADRPRRTREPQTWLPAWPCSWRVVAGGRPPCAPSG